MQEFRVANELPLDIALRVLGYPLPNLRCVLFWIVGLVRASNGVFNKNKNE